jgi:hypothetical protein
MIRSNVASRMAGPDPENPAVLRFATRRRAVQENAGTIRLRVTRSGNTTIPASADYARSRGAATPDADFTLTPGSLDFTEGVTRRTIPVTITDDREPERREALTVALANQAPGTVLRTPTSMSVAIRPSDQRPDGWISTSARSGYIGDDIYNLKARKQTKRLPARRTKTRAFYVRVYNDGNVFNRVAVHGTHARRGSRVRYFAGSTDISATMRSAEGWRVRVKPGGFRLVKVRIRILSSAAYDSRKPARVTATWTGDGVRRDAVKAVVKVIR